MNGWVITKKPTGISSLFREVQLPECLNEGEHIKNLFKELKGEKPCGK